MFCKDIGFGLAAVFGIHLHDKENIKLDGKFQYDIRGNVDIPHSDFIVPFERLRACRSNVV
jgi:hypothetical protein